MPAMKLPLSCAAALLLCLLIASLQEAEAQCGGFQLSCKSFFIGSNGVFSAECRDTGGSYQGTSLNLNPFIGNDDGELVDGANFAASCDELGYNNQKSPEVAFFLTGRCKLIGGATQLTSYKLSNHLVNSNGVLKWNYCSFSSLLENISFLLKDSFKSATLEGSSNSTVEDTSNPAPTSNTETHESEEREEVATSFHHRKTIRQPTDLQ